MKIKVSMQKNNRNIVDELVNTIQKRNLKYTSPYTYFVKDKRYQNLSLKEINKVAKRLDCGIDFENIDHQVMFDFTKTYEEYVDEMENKYFDKSPCYIVCFYLETFCMIIGIVINAITSIDIVKIFGFSLIIIHLIFSIIMVIVSNNANLMLKTMYKITKHELPWEK